MKDQKTSSDYTMHIHNIGNINTGSDADFRELDASAYGLYHKGRDGVRGIATGRDGKVEFIAYDDKTLALVKSAMGYPAIYPVPEAQFEPPAKAVLMDLDGTSVHSEKFWIWTIQQSTGRLLGDANFELEPEDEPHVSGHSVSEHLQYCINKYCPDKTVEEARQHYFDIVRHEMREILEGRGYGDAFEPAPGLKEFLLALKERGIKIGLVTSGLYEKAWPEIVSAFRKLELGDPNDFYDAIITAGFVSRQGRQAGTLGELAPKPHPWLYAEIARVGLGIDERRRRRVIGIEDSGAGVVALRLAGFAALGIGGGNIPDSGVRPLLYSEKATLKEALPFILG